MSARRRLPAPPRRLGAYPGHTYTDVQSGIGAVHNALMLDKPLKTVVSAPFRPFPRVGPAR